VGLKGEAVADQPTSSEELEFDRSIIGVEFEVGKIEVTKEAILEYAEVLGETNPLFTDEEFAKAQGYRGLVAPPTYYTMIRTSALPDPKVTFGTTQFNAGQHCEFGTPMCAGDVITVKAVVSDVYAKTGRTGTMVFTVRKQTYENQLGEQVTMVEQSWVRRSMQGAG